MRGNPTFEALAHATGAGQARFARVIYRPWTSVGSDAFGKSLGVGGLPVYLTYQDGKLVRRNDGIADQNVLQKVLLDGLGR